MLGVIICVATVIKKRAKVFAHWAKGKKINKSENAQGHYAFANTHTAQTHMLPTRATLLPFSRHREQGECRGSGRSGRSVTPSRWKSVTVEHLCLRQWKVGKEKEKKKKKKKISSSLPYWPQSPYVQEWEEEKTWAEYERLKSKERCCVRDRTSGMLPVPHQQPKIKIEMFCLWNKQTNILQHP